MEALAAMFAFIHLLKMDKSHWRWFSVYLIIIFAQEITWFFNLELLGFTKKEYYTFFGIPFQYLFFFWLFAYKSLKNKMLYVITSLIYIATYLPVELLYKKQDIAYSLNLTTGTLLLVLLTILEFLKQIRNDDILKFRKNKMFYITVGVVLFYIGTYPFWTFYNTLAKKPYLQIWNAYYLYFLISNCIMYLLFTMSFIWGKIRF